ncbi:di-heme-cytochrome C peroxidase [Ruegeria sp. PrR005]|uniref:Cytochrome c domain-containing protein n=1 Tax=Ruegeria sp. PrR005 TaxID=2706882 RepID=A0A6B2NST8_9RHOB|nr:di-heme-cytochrome C peroxidase [Ruegeria sp. PrR005]NDW47192.1 hypothetical protein [Ruegeria sp. PrR005]
MISRHWIGLTLLGALMALGAPQAQAQSGWSVCRDVECLDQGWNDAQRRWWYTTTQGSRLLPLDWLVALEQPGAGQRAFLDGAYMEELGYIANPDPVNNPNDLPLGWVIDQDQGLSADLMCDTFPETCDALTMRKPWVGLTCSACHTNEITHQGRRLRIEGAPTLADFQRMEEDLLQSLKDTVADRTRFDRFARAVLGQDHDIDTRASLETQLGEQIAWQQALADKNAAPKVRYGHARLDAQGHILNKVALTVRDPDQITNVLADAPASYPHIWNTSQQEQLQWNGIAKRMFKIRFLGESTELGALVRNTSEVIGVFAHIETDKFTVRRGYPSSARVRELVSLERQLESLQSPKWPEDMLGAIDWDLAARGREVFTRQIDGESCADCHSDMAPTDTTSPMATTMTPLADIGTDVFTTCNTFLHRSKPGQFGGQYVITEGARIDPVEDFTRMMLVNATIGAIWGKRNEVLGAILYEDDRPSGDRTETGLVTEYLPGVTDEKKKADAQDCLTQEHPLLAYKARALNGIWATAPYLHNGSVPTLYDLLLPARMRNVATDLDAVLPADAETRPEVFGVGSREFDPVKVGFVSDLEQNPFTFRARDEDGEPIPGNFNSGHDYGTATLSEEDRRALLEYLKTL